MKRFALLLTALWMASSPVAAQDTLTVVQYNLLNYGNYTSYCSQAVNPVADKDEYLKLITDQLRPDIFSVNELSPDGGFADRILNNVLNRDGETRYARVNVPNYAGSELVNMVYYNTQKLAYCSQVVAQSTVRDIDVVKFYFRGSGLEQGDTAFVNCVVAHLKAGEAASDAAERTAMVMNALNYMDQNLAPGNYLFMGDLNLYSHTEGAFVALTGSFGPNWTFNDPADRVGEWHNNDLYASVHTQSTHTSSGCWASGGMDDRFDFILATNPLINGTQQVQYVPGSYSTLGQDGQHFNKALTDAPALQLPADLVNALYTNSDHLPVSLRLKVDQSLGVEQANPVEWFAAVVANRQLRLNLRLLKATSLQLTLHNLRGEQVWSQPLSAAAGSQSFDFPVGSHLNGLFLLSVTSDDGRRTTRKVMFLN